MQDRETYRRKTATLLGLSGQETADRISPWVETQRGLSRVCLLLATFSWLTSSPLLAEPGGNGKRVIPIQTSTIPANGDLNPYGVAFVPPEFPDGSPLSPGDVLVSNFNSSGNTQGTGTTIVSITPTGQQTLFFQGTSPLGLTTALGVLKKGFVLVGNLPTNAQGSPQQGSLLILDKKGALLQTLTDPTFLDGPWDLAILDQGNSAIVFVSCVLNGTVTRIDLAINGNTISVKTKVTIASGYQFGLNQAALVVGPTGLVYDGVTGTLYVASTADNKIFAVPNAASAGQSKGTGNVIYNDPAHLHGPLGLVLAPNGHIISSQGDAINPSSNPAQQSEIVEFTKTGKFVNEFSIDSAVGAAFGIAINVDGHGGIQFAAVDDAMNSLTVYDLREANQ
jgi:hypothetical protein